MEEIKTVDKFVNFIENLPTEIKEIFVNLDINEWIWQSDADPWINPYNTDFN